MKGVGEYMLYESLMVEEASLKYDVEILFKHDVTFSTSVIVELTDACYGDEG